MTTSEFEELLERYEKGTCTPEERKHLEQWLNQRGQGRSPFTDDEDRKAMEAALHQAIRQSTGMRNGNTVFMSGWWKIAASFLLLLAAGYGIWKYTAGKSAVNDIAGIASAADTIEKVLLADGTLVWLKPGSKLTYPDHFEASTRVVSLEGEALFEVKKDPSHPFVIHCGDITTTVLGTSFNIKITPENTEVYVLTGKVSVTAEQTKENIQLLPSEAVVYAHATKQLQKINTQPAERTVTYTQGTEYVMDFQNTSVHEIAARIETKFDVDVTVTGPVDDCLITADFTDQSLENTMDMIAEALNATYTIDENTVLLKGNGCQ